MMTKRVASIVLSASLLFSGVSSFAADEYLTRGEAADMLVTAADDYNDGITVSDIMSGYEDGSLREDSNVTRAEMLVMLERAFGDLPEPAGHNARVAIPAEKFADVPEWALEPFTVNAYYTSTSNDITFPAAILQEPLYDVNASFEENLGGIGFIIAHEITHAFDNNGAKFDENGNAADWWAPEDRVRIW